MDSVGHVHTLGTNLVKTFITQLVYMKRRHVPALALVSFGFDWNNLIGSAAGPTKGSIAPPMHHSNGETTDSMCCLNSIYDRNQ